MINLDELERLAKAAGADEWGTFEYMPPGTHEGVHVWDRAGDAVCECFANFGHLPEGITEIDLAEFIAAANPAAILSIIAELREAKLDADRWRAEMNLRNDPTVAIMFAGTHNRCSIYRSGELFVSGESYVEAIDAAAARDQGKGS